MLRERRSGARNPNVDDLVRERALADLEQFIDAFASRPNFTFGQADGAATDAAAPGAAVAAPATAELAPAAAADDGLTLEGEAHEVAGAKAPPRQMLDGPQAAEAGATPRLAQPDATGAVLPPYRDVAAASSAATRPAAVVQQLVREGWALDGRALVGPNGEARALNAVELAAAREAARKARAAGPESVGGGPVKTEPTVTPDGDLEAWAAKRAQEIIAAGGRIILDSSVTRFQH